MFITKNPQTSVSLGVLRFGLKLLLLKLSDAAIRHP